MAAVMVAAGAAVGVVAIVVVVVVTVVVGSAFTAHDGQRARPSCVVVAGDPHSAHVRGGLTHCNVEMAVEVAVEVVVEVAGVVAVGCGGG
jgi:hypothetical protein